METAISTLTVLPSTKAELINYITLVKQEILSGNTNALRVAVQIKSLEEILKALKEDPEIKDCIMSEANLYPEKVIEIYGCKVEKSSRTVYDYSNCGDPVYNDLIEQKEKLDEIIKARQAVIKSGVNPETGETFYPPQTKRTEFLKIEFKK